MSWRGGNKGEVGVVGGDKKCAINLSFRIHKNERFHQDVARLSLVSLANVIQPHAEDDRLLAKAFCLSL